MLSHLGYVMCIGRYAVYLTDDGGHELYANDAEGIAQLLDKLTSRTWELAEAQHIMEMIGNMTVLEADLLEWYCAYDKRIQLDDGSFLFKEYPAFLLI